MKIINKQLVKEAKARSRCELCGGRWALSVHHEPTRGAAMLETRLTLLLICCYCHAERHGGSKGHPTELRIIDAICRREGCSAFDRELVTLLLKRMPKEAGCEWLLAASGEWPESAKVLLDRTWNERDE